MDILSYSSRAIEELCSELKTSTQGLSTSDAKKRLEEYGLNKIEKSRFLLIDFLCKNLNSYFIYLLVGASVASLLLGNYFEGIMILFFTFLNIALGFYQEYKAHKASELLSTYLISHIQVVRDEKIILIDTVSLVPGDLILLEPGTILPADIRFIKTHNLMIDESSITGESIPVEKNSDTLINISALYQATNLGFSSTTVVEGTGAGIIIAAGKSTISGTLSSLTKNIIKESIFAREINQFSKYIMVLVLCTLLLIFFINLLIKGSQTDIFQLLLFSIALAVGITPEALPLVITFCLSRGAIHLAKNKVIVTRLAAIEDLGSIDVLCSDKTGTLTENNLQVAQIYGEDKQKTLLYANLAGSGIVSHSTHIINPIDNALWIALDSQTQKDFYSYHKRFERSFDYKRLRNEVIVETDHTSLLLVRGVIDTVLNRCTIDDKKSILEWGQEQEKKGNRVIVIAFKQLEISEDYAQAVAREKDFSFLGMISFLDPIKKDAKQALLAAQNLGISLKILTGDSAQVAGAIGYEIGLIDNPEKVLTGATFQSMNKQEKKRALYNYTIFARIQPEQKYEIIGILQEDHQVGYLGDGINDLPALKKANVAIVVQGAADVAREAADIILLKKSLNNIINGIYEGRIIYANTIKYIKMELASIFGNFYSIAIASLFINFLPLLPVQILLINVIADIPMISLATDSVDKDEIKAPKSYSFKDILILSTILGIISSLFDFITFALYYTLSPQILQTNLFIENVLTALVLIFSIRTHRFFLYAKRPSLSLLILTLLTGIISMALPFTKFGQLLFSFSQPPLYHLMQLIIITVAYLCVSETAKMGYYYFLPIKNIKKDW